MSDERLTPEAVLVVTGKTWRTLPVLRTIAHPPGQHPEGCPLVATCTAVELVTEAGSRWWGFERAWIGSDLRMHVAGWDDRNEIVRGWETV